MNSEHAEVLERLRERCAALDAAIASLSAPNGEVVVTRDEAGAIVAVTRQDAEGRILSVIAEAVAALEAARAEVERLKQELQKAPLRRLQETSARAERLAEALLELCNVIDGHEVPVAVEAKAAHARDALRDHD